MKKFILRAAAGTALILAAGAGCASTRAAAPRGGVSLDAAVQTAARDIAGSLEEGTRVAIVGFDSESAGLSDYIMEELAGALVGSKLQVADRANLAYVRKELHLQLSGDVDDKSAQAIGKFVGAQAVIAGQFIAAGDAYRFRAQSVHVESAVRKTSTRLDVQNTAKLRKLLAALRSSKTVSRAADHGAAENAAPTTAGAFLDKGLLFAGRGEYDTAIAFFTDAIKLDPNLAPAYHSRGTAYGSKGDYDRAIADLSQAIKLDPNLAFAYNNRGNAYSGKGDYDRAIADYTQAIKLDPNLAPAYNNRGNAYSGKGDYDRAIADYTQAIKLDPNYAPAYYNRGTAYDDKGDYDRAIADLSQAIKLDPNYASAYYNRGNAYSGKGDYDRAIADYTQAIKLDPNYAFAYYNRGAAYFNKGDYDQAAADFSKALSIDPNNADAKQGLEIVRRQGR